MQDNFNSYQTLAKIRHLLFLVFCFSLAFSANTHAKENSFVVVIDPGHGGRHPGAIGKKVKEKDINLAVALRTGEFIQKAHPDVKVIYTRKKDVFVALHERANIANKAKANLFISIHCNASTKKNVKGAEVYTFGISNSKENQEVVRRENSAILLEENYEQNYDGFDPYSPESYILFEFLQNKFTEQSVNFASLVQKELVKTAKRKDRGVKPGEYLVLQNAGMPRVLIELDFITNPEIENYLANAKTQETLSRCICNAFTDYKKEYDRKQATHNLVSIEEVPTKETPKQETPLKETPKQEVLPKETPKQEVLPKETPKQETPPKTNIAEEKPRQGKVYKIQIMASTKKLKEKDPRLKGHKADYYFEKNLYKYTVGESSDKNEIQALISKVRKDFKDAFIITFENGVKVAN